MGNNELSTKWTQCHWLQGLFIASWTILKCLDDSKHNKLGSISMLFDSSIVL
jgi:hypothetical protein